MPSRRPSVLTAHLARVPAGAGQAVILAELRAAVLSGAVPPGCPVPVEEVAAAFDVSRIPVREALKTLVGEDLVTQAPRGGYAVARLSTAELAEIYVARDALEAPLLAASVAAATPQDDATAAAAHAALQAALEAGDAQAYQRGSRDFHLALLRPAGMHRLLHLVEQVWNVTEPVAPMTRTSARERRALHGDHAEMLSAFVARDVERVLAASRAHHRHLATTIAALPADDEPVSLR